jgi:anthranilate/para-aminobenzoate synthase component II
MFILIDNYDSFTWNLWHFLSDLGADVEIIRNDACTAPAIIAKQPQGVIISPGYFWVVYRVNTNRHVFGHAQDHNMANLSGNQ